MPKATKDIMGNIVLARYDDIFQPTTSVSATNTNSQATGESVVHIPLAELHPPEFHPFQVLDDESMTSLVKSIKEHGVHEPGLVRPRPDGGYELLCGNRRKRACEIAGVSTLPVIIRDLDDDSAAIAMVDSNLEQREKLLHSEKAWAYRVKLEALNHQGVKSDNPGQLSVEILSDQTGESKNQIFRYVRLTELVVALIDKVDANKLSFNAAVDLSYLSQTEQIAVATAMDKYDIKPAVSQANRLKKLKQAGKLNVDMIDAMLSEVKKPAKGEPAGTIRYRKFFPPEYSMKQIESVITNLLKQWSQQHLPEAGGM